MIYYTEATWRAEGLKLFGDKRKDWKFICPNCKTVQSAQSFRDAGVDRETIQQGIVGFSCIGRFTRGKVGCDWTLGGLMQIHEAQITTEENRIVPVFEFADENPSIEVSHNI